MKLIKRSMLLLFITLRPSGLICRFVCLFSGGLYLLLYVHCRVTEHTRVIGLNTSKTSTSFPDAISQPRSVWTLCSRLFCFSRGHFLLLVLERKRLYSEVSPFDGFSHERSPMFAFKKHNLGGQMGSQRSWHTSHLSQEVQCVCCCQTQSSEYTSGDSQHTHTHAQTHTSF